MQTVKIRERLDKILETLEKAKSDLDTLVDEANIFVEKDISYRLTSAYEDEESIFSELIRAVCLVEGHLDCARVRSIK